MTVQLLTEHHLGFLSFKGSCTGSSVSTLVNIPHCWKSHATAHICSAQSENLDNSGIALRKVRIPKLADRVRILTLYGTIPELSVRKVRIGTK